MWRTAFVIFITLITTISGMMLWQWKAYSKQNISIEENGEKVVQEIMVKTDNDHLLITQKIVGLTPGREYTTILPDSLQDWSCVKEDGEDCESVDENPHTYLPEDNEIQFQYIITVPNDNSAFQIDDWTTILPEVSIKRTELEISDRIRREGSWVAGLQLQGFREMDLIDYYLFSGDGDAPSLYWQPQSLNHFDAGMDVDYYFEKPRMENAMQFKEIKSLEDFPFVAVVLSEQYRERSGKGIVFSPAKSTDAELKRQLINYYFEEKYNFAEKWLLDVFTSYTVKQPAVTEKGKAVLAELNNKLSEEEIKEFFSLVNHGNESMSAQKLDNFLKKIKGNSTRFFSLNKEDSKSFIPLYFYDDRKIMIGNGEVKGIEVVIDKGKMLYPFIETMKALGFELKVLPDQETILLMKENNSYRFYLNSNIFIYNEEDYGLLESPLTNFNGNIYMNKQWIEALFKVKFEEDEEKIKLSL